MPRMLMRLVRLVRLVGGCGVVDGWVGVGGGHTCEG